MAESATLEATGPVVSVIIPVRDGARFIDDALASVAAQRGAPPLEVIVVDDGSTDASVDRAQRHAGVTVLRQDHRGPAAARNLGIARARGSHLAFLDADDRWTTDKLARQLDHLATHPACDVVLGLQHLVLDGPAELPPWVTEPSAWMPFAARDRHRGQIPLTSLVVARDVFARIGPFDETMRLAEDLDWVLRALDAGLGVETLDTIVLERRLHAGNASNAVDEMQRGVLTALSRRAARHRARSTGSAPTMAAPGPPTVAVVIACRDHGDLLGEAIRSVQAQSRPVDELIVVDDGSADDTFTIAGTAAPEARVVRQPPAGSSAARNLGAALATSSHLLFLDADDRLTPDAIRALVAALSSPRPAVDGTAPPATVVPDAALGRTREFVDGDGDRLRPPQDASLARLLGAMLFPTSVFRDLGGLDRDLPRGEAIDLQHRAAHVGLSIRATDEVVLERRLHGANGGLADPAAGSDYLAVIRRAVTRSRAAREPG
jgi:glycosyltransferase involved in cell wall biosynthesis